MEKSRESATINNELKAQRKKSRAEFKARSK